MTNHTGGQGPQGLPRRALLAGGAALAVSARPVAAQRPAPRRSALAYIGTYTPQAVRGAAWHGEGINLARLDLATGALEMVQTYPAPSPSWITLDPHRRFLYAVNEIDDFGGAKHGSVTAYSIAPGSGALTQINAVSSPTTAAATSRCCRCGRTAGWATRSMCSRTWVRRAPGVRPTARRATSPSATMTVRTPT